MSAEPLSDLVTLVRAPNPSPITLDGTNTYIVGSIVIDPGPAIDAHLDAVLEQVGQPTLIVLTHRHPDHAEGAERLAAMSRAPLAAFGAAAGIHGDASPIHDGQRIESGGVTLVASHTPGHASDHLCFWLEQERALFTGDHVLGRGTTVIAYPDGDLTEYLASLDRALAFAPERLYPGHGPVVDEPDAVLRWYRTHRLEREQQVLAGLASGDDTVEALVARIYADVDRALHGAAGLSVRAHLAKLERDGAVERSADRWRLR